LLCAAWRKNLGQPNHRRRIGGDHICEHRPRADRRQLIDVAHQHELRPGPQREQHRMEQPRVDHRRLIDDQYVEIEWILAAAHEPPTCG